MALYASGPLSCVVGPRTRIVVIRGFTSMLATISIGYGGKFSTQIGYVIFGRSLSI